MSKRSSYTLFRTTVQSDVPDASPRIIYGATMDECRRKLGEQRGIEMGATAIILRLVWSPKDQRNVPVVRPTYGTDVLELVYDGQEWVE